MEKRNLMTIGIIVGILVILAVLVGVLLLTQNQAVSETAQVYFVGTEDDADCAIITSGEQCLMIDTGEQQDAPHILEVLEELGIGKIDVLILTHPDKDHIGGASDLIDEIEVGQVLEPDYRQADERLDALREKIDQKGILREILTNTKNFSLGELDVTVYPPMKNDYGKDNNYSLATLVRHGKTTMFFAGDAQKARTEELLTYSLPSPVDLYKVAYHGREVEGSDALIQKLAPRYAVVTALKADESVTKQLWAAGAEVDYTRGWDLVFQSDGETIEKIGETQLQK